MEDKAIVKAFHKVRPPGHGVVARQVRAALPSSLKRKVGERTVIRRLNEKGFSPKKKLSKADQSVKNAQARLKFSRKHQDKTPAEWKNSLDAIGDIKEFTWYPQDMRPRLAQLRASWTYMNDKERTQTPFLRPKRWFHAKDYKRVKKQKVFGLTASNGKILAFECPMPMTADTFAKMVRTKIKPFLKKTFPRKPSFQILLDGEKIFRAPVAKAALKDAGISLLKNWPPHSPDLNPQENVWPHAETRLRQLEKKKGGTFEEFGQLCVKAVSSYPDGKTLIPSMAKRMEACAAAKGGMTKY